MARSSADAARLEAAAAAKRMHRTLEIERRVTELGGAIDVFEAIADLDIPLMFKPLDSAQGLYLPRPMHGILITTKRTLNIQRFTAAHELGHAALNHESSIDREILERGPIGPTNGRDLKEVAADAFAAEFLLPRWLYRMHIRRQGWTINHLKNPDVTYQLSLRLGASYKATCYGLLSNQILDRGDVNILLDEEVAGLKHRLGQGHRPTSSWADVWRITERDNGGLMTGTERDLVQMEFPENSTSGFVWDVDPLREAGLEILDDRAEFSRDPIMYGVPTIRRIVARPTAPARANVHLSEAQPWNNNIEAQVSLTLAFDGAEKPGFSRVERHRRGIE